MGLSARPASGGHASSGNVSDHHAKVGNSVRFPGRFLSYTSPHLVSVQAEPAALRDAARPRAAVAGEKGPGNVLVHQVV